MAKNKLHQKVFDDTRDTVLFEKWREICICVASIESDMVSHVNGNKIAGVRVREGLSHLKKITKEAKDLSILLNRRMETERRKASHPGEYYGREKNLIHKKKKDVENV